MGALGFVIGLILIWIYILHPTPEQKENIALRWKYRHVNFDNYDERKIFAEAGYDKDDINEMISQYSQRQFWGNEYTKENGHAYMFRKSAMKYCVPDKNIEASLNLEYLLGYKGYYNTFEIMPDDTGSFLKDLSKYRDSRKYMTPAYYYHNYAEIDDDIMVLLGKKMTVRDFNIELKKRLYMPAVLYEGYTEKYQPIYSHIYFNEIISSAEKLDHNCASCVRYETRYIKLDARDRMKVHVLPRFEYVGDGEVWLKVKISGTDLAYEECVGYDEFIPMDAQVEIVGLKCNMKKDYIFAGCPGFDTYNMTEPSLDLNAKMFREGYISKELIQSKEELDMIKNGIKEKDLKLKEKNIKHLEKYSICSICGEIKYRDIQLPNSKFICKSCRNKALIPY